MADTLAGAGLAERVGWCVVSEAGASVYRCVNTLEQITRFVHSSINVHSMMQCAPSPPPSVLVRLPCSRAAGSCLVARPKIVQGRDWGLLAIYVLHTWCARLGQSVTGVSPGTPWSIPCTFLPCAAHVSWQARSFRGWMCPCGARSPLHGACRCVIGGAAWVAGHNLYCKGPGAGAAQLLCSSISWCVPL